FILVGLVTLAWFAGTRNGASAGKTLAEPVAPETAEPPHPNPRPQEGEGTKGPSLAGGRDWLRTGLVVLAGIDLLLAGRHRDVDTGPIKSLVEQSPVLQRLAEEARTTQGRIVSSLGNLPMVAGAASVPAYRTLDIPLELNATRDASAPLLK